MVLCQRRIVILFSSHRRHRNTEIFFSCDKIKLTYHYKLFELIVKINYSACCCYENIQIKCSETSLEFKTCFAVCCHTVQPYKSASRWDIRDEERKGRYHEKLRLVPKTNNWNSLPGFHYFYCKIAACKAFLSNTSFSSSLSWRWLCWRINFGWPTRLYWC